MEIKKKEIAYDGYFKIYKLTVEHDGQTFTREQFDRGDAVAALIYDTRNQQYILAKQFRVGAEADLTEVVAGMIDAGEEPEQSITREIEEETGYEVDRLEHVDTFYTSPGGTTEKIYLYYAEVSAQKGQGGGNAHENEHITLVHLTADEFEKFYTPDAKTVIAQQWVKLRKS